MPVAADVLNSLTGFLSGLNQQADTNQTRQLEALKLLASQPGASVVPATAGQSPPPSFFQRLTGQQPPSASGAPVVNLGGQALTVGKAPSIAEALPGLFATPPEGLPPGLLEIIGKIPGTPTALSGVATLFANAHTTTENRKLREAQLTEQRLRQDKLDQERERLQFERIQTRGHRDATQQAGQSLKEQKQRTDLLTDLQKRYSDAGKPVPPEFQDPQMSLEDAQRALLGAPPALPKGSTKRAGLTPNAQLAFVAKILKTRQETGVPLTAEEEALLAKGEGVTITELAPIYARVSGTGGKHADSRKYIQEIATAHDRIRKLTDGESGIFGTIPGLAALQDPAQREARSQAIRAQQERIRVNARLLSKLPDHADMAAAMLRELDGEAAAGGTPGGASPGLPTPPVAGPRPALPGTTTAPGPRTSAPVVSPSGPIIKSIRRKE